MMKVLHRSDLERVLSRASDSILIASDFDGTLAPIVPYPSAARLPEGTEAILRDLLDSGRVTLAILSGRSLSDLRGRIHFPAILAGNHGLEITGGGIEFVHRLAAERAHLIAEAHDCLKPCLDGYSGAWIEHKHLTATIHFRQVPATVRYKLVWSVRQVLRPFGANLGMRAGKCSLEVHPRVAWDKGAALRYIREAAGLQDSTCLVLGDDATDESMFRAAAGATTVRVGAAVRTSATYFLPNPAAVSNVLAHSLEILTANSSPLARAAV